jgi:hypothetical protein
MGSKSVFQKKKIMASREKDGSNLRDLGIFPLQLKKIPKK